MATEADVPAPTCETRREEVGDVLDQAANTSINKLHQEEKIQVDTLNEPPTTGGENLLRTPSIGEVHSDANSVFSKGIQQYAERAETQLSRDTTSDHHGMNDSGVENLNVQVKTEDDIPFNIISDLSKESECPNDQNMMTSETINEATSNSDDLRSKNQEKTIDAVDTQKEALESFSTVVSNCPDEGLRENVQGVTSDSTDRKTIEEVDTKKEVLENFPTISNEEIEENSTINVDVSETKNAEELGKESEETSSQLPLAREAIDDESTVMHEAQIEGELREAETCETEKSTETTLSKIEAEIEKPNDSLYVASKVAKASDLDLDEKPEDKTVDATEIKKETQEDVGIVSYEKNEEENSMIQMDCSEMEREEHLQKERETPSLTEAPREADDKESDNMQACKNRDDDGTKDELLENEKDTSSTSVNEEARLEMPIESSQVANEDINEFDSSKDAKMSSTDEQILTTDAQEISCDKIEEKNIDAAETNEETLQNLGTIISNEKTEENSLIQVDGSRMENEAYLEKEIENTSLKEASKDEAKNIDSTQDYKKSAASEDMETTCSLEEQSLTGHPQVIMGERTVDGTETNEETLESIATIATQEEHLEKESGTSSLTEAPKEENNGEESKNMHERGNRDEDVINDEFLENEKYSESNLVREEAQEEKPVDSSQIATKDVNECDSSQDTKTSSIEEQILTTDTQEVSIEEKTFDAAETKEETPEDKSSINEDGSQKPSSEEALTCNVNEDESKITDEAKSVDESSRKTDLFENEKNAEDTSVQDRDTSSPEERSLTVDCGGTICDHKDDETNNATSLEEETLEDKNVTTTIPYEDEKEKSLEQDDCSQMEQNEHLEKESVKESTSLVEEEQRTHSLQVATEDIKASAPGQTETSSTEEQISTTEEILGENEEKTIDPPHKNEETVDAQNVATIIPHEDTQENSLIQVDCSEKEHDEYREKESENPSSNEAATEETNEDESRSICKPENGDNDVIEAELLENETASTVVNEEAPLEKSNDCSQVDIEDTKESYSCQDTKMRSIEERILTIDPHEISSAKIEGKGIGDNAANVAIGDNESPIEDNGSQMPNLEEDLIDTSNNDESTIKHEAEFVDESSTKANSSENEKNTENTSVNEEVSTESLQAAAIEDIEASIQDRETSSLEEQSLAIKSERTVGDHEKDKRNDATSVQEEAPQDKSVGTTILYEQEKSLEQDDCSQVEQNDDLKMESEIPSLTEARTRDTKESIMEEAPEEKAIDSLQVATEAKILTTEEIVGDETPENVSNEDTQGNSDCSKMEHEKHLERAATEETNEDEPRNIHESENRDDDEIKAKLLENEQYTTCTLMKEEVCLEKPIDSSQVNTEDINESDSSQGTKISSVKEQILTANPQEISSDKIEGKTIDAAEMEEETQEDIVANVPSGDNEDKPSIEEDGTQKPSLEEASTLDANEQEATIMHDVKYVDESSTRTDLSENEKKTEDTLVKEEVSIQSLQVAAEDIKAFALVQDRETSSIEEQSVTTNCQEIVGEYDKDKISNAIGMKEQTPVDKNVTTSILYEDTEEHSLNQGDCLQMEHNEHSEKESESPSLTEAQTEKTNDDESKNIHEPENRDDDLIRAELLETEKCTESTSVKEEAHVEESIDSMQVSTEDIKACDSSQDTKISSIEEQILIAETQEISGGEIKERTIDAVDSSEDTLEDTPINVPNGDNEDNSLIKEDDLLESEKNIEDTLVKEEVPEDIKAFDSVQDIEMSSLKDRGLPADCQGIIGDDTKDKTADATSVMQRESTSIIKEREVEKPVDSLQLASEDIKTNASCQNTEISSTEEQIRTTDPQEISCVYTEEIAIDATHIYEETVEVQNVTTTISHEDIEENSLNKVDCPQIEQKEHLEKESEDISVTKAPIVDTIERTLVKEEAQVEKLIDSFQVASEDVKASSSGPDQETSSIEEQIQTADRQAISGDSFEEKTIDAVCKEEEILEDKGTNISNGDMDNSLPAKVDEPQKPSFEEASTGNATDYEPTIMHEAKFADKNLAEAKLFENEKNREDILVREEVSIESVQVAAEDIKTFTLGQDRETSSLEERSLTPNPREITGDHTEEKTIDATKLKEETPEYKNVSTIIPCEDKEEKLLEQDDCSHKEHHENESEIPYLTEARTRDTEEREVEKPVDSLQLASEDIKAVASCQDTETSSIEEQILTTDPQEISYVNTEEKTIDEAHINENVTTISHEDSEGNSLNQVDCPQIEQKEYLEKESEDISLTIAPIVDTVERTLVKEEAQVEKLIDSFQVATEDVKASSSGPDQETSSIEEQIQTADRQVIPGDSFEEKTIDAVCKEEEILEDMGTNISNGDNEDSSPIKVDEPQKPSFEEASTGNATDYEPTITHEAKFADENLVEAKLSENEKIREDILVKEEVSIESIESVQVVAEDVKTSTLGQDRETSSLEEQSRTPNPREIIGDHKEDKTIDATKLNEETPENKNVSTIIPCEDKEEKSLDQDDCLQMEHHEKESEIPSLTEARTRDTKEQEVEKSVDSLQLAGEDSEVIKAVASCQNTETSSIEEQILTTDPQEISYVNTEERTIDAAHIKEGTVENVTTTTSHEDSEENSLNQVDCPQIEQKEHLEKESEDISLTKASIEDTVERTLVKEEAQVEKLIDPFQVANEDVKAYSSGPDPERSSIKEHIQNADRQAIPLDNIEEKTIDVVCKEEEILEDMATNISNEDNEDSLPIKVDEPQKPSFEEASTGNATDYEPTIMDEAGSEVCENEKNREDILVKEEVSIESVQVVAEDIKTSTLGQDRETSSLEEQSLTPNPPEVIGDHKKDKPIDATKLKEETPENKNVATTIPQEDAIENSIIQDGSQVEHEKHVEKESENSSSREAPTVKEETTEDTKPSASTQVTEISSIEETILTEHPRENSGGNIGEKTIDATETKEETLEVQVSKEIENVDIKAKTTELNEEEGYLNDLQMTTAVNITAREEQGSDSSAIKIPNVDDKDVIVDIAEDPNCKQDDGSSIPNVSEEHENISKNVADVTSLVSEASELNSDHKVVEEANSCGDKTDTEKVGVLDDGSITIPSNDNLVETEAKEITEAEAQVPDGEKEAELIQQEPEAGTNQKEIEELPICASHDGSESNRLNGEEEKGSDYCKEISESSDSVPLEEVLSSNVISKELSTSNAVQESISITEQEVVNEEAQKQDEDLHVLALTKDSSVEKIEKDVQLCLTSAHVSDITQELQKLEEASGTSTDEKIEEIIEKTGHKESEVVEHSTQDKYIEHLDQDGTTKSFLDDQKPTESEQEEKELKADTAESAVGLEDNLPNRRSIVDLETKIDEAPEITETTPTVIEGQEIESRSVGETSILISQCEKDEFEHASVGSVIEKSDTNEVEFARGEYKSVYESKHQVLESTAQVQSCDVISKAEETKTDEEKLEVAVEVNSVAEDRSEPKETTRVDISSNKIKKEHELVEDYQLGSCKEEVKEDEVKQEEKINTEEILDEVIKNAHDAEKVLKVSGEADDKAIVEPKDNLLDRSVHLEEGTKGVEEFVSALDTKETQVSDHIHIKTGTEDSIKEVNSSSVEFLEDGDNRKGAGGVDNELEEDEGLLNQNSNTSVLDAAALPKRLDEDIICEAAPTKTLQKTVEESEDKKENANTTMMEQQEVDNISEHESLLLPGFAPGRESEKHNQKDEICSSHEVQAKDEENQTLSARKSEEAHEADICSKPDEDEDRNTYAEAENLEFSSHTKDTSEVSRSDGAAHDIPEDNKNSTTINEQSEEKYQNKSTESQISTVSKDIQLIEEGSKATSVTAETQEILARSYSSAVPEQTGVDSRQVDRVSDECQGIKETSTSIQPSKISKSEIIQEYKVGTSSAADHQLTELHDLPQESHLLGSEVNMAQRDGPMDLQKVTDVSEDVQKLKEGCIDVSNKENAVVAIPDENMEATVSSKEQEAEAIQKASASETFQAEIEQQPGRTFEAVTKAKGANYEEEKTQDDECSDLIENSCSTVTEMVSKSNIHQSSMEDTAQSYVENKESQQQTVLVATSPPEKDKHAIREADHTKNVNLEDSLGKKNITVAQHGSSAECSQGEGELSKPSKQEEAHCGHEEEKTSQETTKSSDKSESKETYKRSQSDLLQVSAKETSQKAYHSTTEKEPTTHLEKTDEAKLEDVKTDEEKDDEEESSEQRRSDLGFEAPVMVDVGDTDVKVTHKKSHNILSGVGSKVKHSIAKVKKAITGKSSHSKPLSPKEGDKYSKTNVS